MSFTDHKITQFQHRIADLPDEPQIPAADLKSRFDACPEELRQSLNAVCDDAARLEARVEGIVVDTFGDTIDKEMLSDELAAELDKLSTAMPRKCEAFFGSYTGNNSFPRAISLGFAPQMIYITRADGYTGSAGNVYHLMALPVETPGNKDYIVLTETGFQLTDATGDNCLNSNNQKYVYFGIK